MPHPSRHCAPVLVDNDQQVSPLRRIELGKGTGGGEHREEFVQKLVHQNPSVIPMHEIEPAFTPLISICMELPTDAGFLDNLWLTPAGGIVLGECKLVRNTQARREVLVQALDYARAIKGWHYDDLQNAVRKARKTPDLSLWEFVCDQTEEGESYSEADFVDAIERRLRDGRFVVLIILDGVQEGLEALAAYLQLHAGLHASLALVELSIWQGIGEGLLVVPRIPLRTVLIERGIVTVDAHGLVRIDPPRELKASRPSLTTKPYTASEPEFYDRLEQKLPGITNRLKVFLADLEGTGIVPEFGRSIILRWHPSADVSASAGFVDASGAAFLGDAVGYATKLGNAPAGKEYLEHVAAMIGGTVRWYENPNTAPMVKDRNGRTLNIVDLLSKATEWKLAIGNLIAETNRTIAKE